MKFSLSSLFGSRTPETPSALALDIGSEFVKAIVFEVEDDHGKVRGTAKERQRLSDMQAGMVTDISGVIKTCEKALERAYTQAGITPEKVIIGIAGELVKGTTTSTTITRNKPNNQITELELREIIGNAQKEILKKSRKDLAWESGYAEIDVQLVNSAVVGVKIDGYRVANPIGFQGRKVEINIYTAYAPSVHLGALEAIVDGLGLDLLSIATEPHAVARCFGSEESTDLSSIFIDVGGGTTDIAVVRSGGLEGTKMFALGGRVFTKRLSTSLKVPYSEAERIKIAYSDGLLSERDTVRVSDYVESDTAVWLSGVELALEEFTESERFVDNRLLPHKIYLCGGGSLLPDLKKAIEDHDFGSLPFAKKIEVQYIKPQQVTNIIDPTKELVSTQDVTPLALANLALDLVGVDSAVSGTVNKILRGLRS